MNYTVAKRGDETYEPEDEDERAYETFLQPLPPRPTAALGDAERWAEDILFVPEAAKNGEYTD